MITLSIIITAHNLNPLVLNVLSSVSRFLSSKPRTDYELLLIDDKSSDGTSQLLIDFAREHEHTIYVRTDYGNIGKVRNHAISLAQGQYITFIDGDDTLILFDFDYLSNFLIEYQPDMLITGIHEVRKPQEEKQYSVLRSINSMTQQKAIEKFLIHKKIQGHLAAKYLKRSLFNNLKIPEVICYEDAFIFPELLKKSSVIYYTDSVTYNYIKRDNSLSSVMDKTRSEIKARVALYMYDIFGEKYIHLSTCHIIDSLFKDKAMLTDSTIEELLCVVRKINIFKFMLDSKVRMSFKRKLLAISRK